MRLYRIRTTAYEEEDFFLMTDLSEQQISEVVNPVVKAERDGEDEYDNELLHSLLKKKYPNKTIIMITEFEEVTF